MMGFNFSGEPEIDTQLVAAALSKRGVAPRVIHEIKVALPRHALGVLLYGSQARGDVSEHSDIDLLVIASFPARTKAVGRVNRSTYDLDQFRTAAGTLFGMHLARDGVLLHDDGAVSKILSAVGEIDEARLWERLRRLATLLSLPEEEQVAQIDGFVRHARYVLRTATYASALHPGPPCFSVSELAERFDDPDLAILLSSHESIHGPPNVGVLGELTERIRAELGGIGEIQYQTLADAIVGLGEAWPEVADAGLLILNRDSSDPYAIIPRIIL